jgi:hypothetical protein
VRAVNPRPTSAAVPAAAANAICRAEFTALSAAAGSLTSSRPRTRRPSHHSTGPCQTSTDTAASTTTPAASPAPITPNTCRRDQTTPNSAPNRRSIPLTRPIVINRAGRRSQVGDAITR